MKDKSFIKIFSLSLLLIFSIETAIYFFYVKPLIQNKSESLFTNANRKLSKDNPTFQPPAPPNSYPMDNITYLRNLYTSFLTSSTLENTYKGTIISVIANQVSDPNTYKVKLTMEDDTMGKFSFNYFKKDLENLTIVSANGDKSTNIYSLKLGDKVEITETIDMMKNFGNNRIKLIIKKL